MTSRSGTTRRIRSSTAGGRVLGPILLTGLLVTACQVTMSVKPAVDVDHEKCVSYGLQKGTGDYASCRIQLEQAREQERQSRPAPLRCVFEDTSFEEHAGEHSGCKSCLEHHGDCVEKCTQDGHVVMRRACER